MYKQGTAPDLFNASRSQLLLQAVAQWLIVAGVFTIPLLGTAAHNLLFGFALLFGLCSFSLRYWLNTLSAYPALAIGLTLFAWLGLSSLWGLVSVTEGLSFLAKYRELLLIPVFVMLLKQRPNIRDAAASVLYASLLLSLIASYLIHFDWVDWTENEHSLKNRIFHGVSMSLFAYLTLRLALSERVFSHLSYRYLAWGIFLLTAFSVFFIENGRTGYVCFLGICSFALLERLGFKKALGLVFAALVVLIGLLVLFGADHIRVLSGHEHLVLPEGAALAEQLQVADIRLEYWVVSCLAFFDHWILGYGVGSFEQAYQQVHSSLITYWEPTRNAHNEILMIGMQSGVVGILLYLGFIFSTAFYRSKDMGIRAECAWMKSGVPIAGLVFVAGLFNSSIMDHGDGILFASALSLMFAGARMPAFIFVAGTKPPTADN
ncbi:MAG: O-antigen ligase family protein [Pontibacterium sp.]